MNKLTLMICPHDTAKKPDQWFRFIQYLNNQLDVNIHLEVSLDFEDFHQHLDQADIVYANPADSIRLREQGFSAVVRPSNLYDEVVYIAHQDIANPTLDSLHGKTLATVKSMLPIKVALHSLKEKGIAPAQLLDKSSWLGVINSVSKNEAPFGIVYKDTYKELSPNTKAMVNAFAESQEKVIFHGIHVSPNAMAHKSELERVLLEMNTTPAGKDVLQELNIEGWCKTTSEEISTAKEIMMAA
ncbi:phosphate/phosphite/phosphonate ABC transporter substrate-binding protein [Coleofasciculus sp. F4-SAH-05]|jgi:ABC-type phosphate/phosphonate transport system substrate-binding protein|uniref:phosphate/phosphite/phosphonate ABC transporter substrate-binding protein n=1 Tax=Coleofasciculus TaxID=669368 RepID=UPI0032F0CB50